MNASELLSDPSRAWSAYAPTDANPWNLAKVAHLHRRAGFRAPWNTLKRDLAEGPEASINRLLHGEDAERFDAEMDAMAARFAASGNLKRLQGTWLYRMIYTPYPLRERMTLFWHDHFATSNAKVNNPSLLRRQNEILRKYALGSFASLLTEIAKDPAMLVWLDCTANRKAHPNENYAREVMELFTLGRGAYTEKDVQAAARAFTGAFIQGDEYHEVAAQHDAGVKTILGQTGPFHGDDVARILLEQPACGRFLARKLFSHFISETDEPSEELLAPIAEVYRSSGYDTSIPIAMILRSQLFYDPTIRRRRVSGPVEFAVGTIRALEIIAPTVSADSLADATVQMGQGLFAPPSVAGWDGGTAWINTTTAIARTNFVLGLVNDTARFKAEALPSKYGIDDPAKFYVDLLVQDALDGNVLERLRGSAAEVAMLVLTTPEYQLA
jgi:uncharacterized protein (DUF1800 family)